MPVLPVSAAPGSSADEPGTPILGPGGDALPLQDHLEWVGPSRFFVRGRRDGVVQVGGVNVAPAAVARHLEALDEVATAAVRLDLRTGRLKAFVVPEPRAYGAAPSPDGERRSTERSNPHPRPDPSCAAVPSQHDPALEARLRAAVAALPAPARPQSYTFGAALPISPAGKPTDWIVPS
jgi:4-coumarate--CoA ligase